VTRSQQDSELFLPCPLSGYPHQLIDEPNAFSSSAPLPARRPKKPEPARSWIARLETPRGVARVSACLIDEGTLIAAPGAMGFGKNQTGDRGGTGVWPSGSGSPAAIARYSPIPTFPPYFHVNSH